MAKIVGMPKLSPTMEEGTVSRWVKREGEDIAVDDLIAEIETDKATMEWRSFDAGVLLKILAPEGTTLSPDAPVAIIGARGDDISALLQPSAPTDQRAPAAAAKTETVTQPAAAPAAAAPPAAAPPAADAPRPSNVGAEQPASGPAEQGRILASPAMRRMAREHAMDLRGKHGSGPGGRIILRDFDELLAAQNAGQAPQRAATTAPPDAALTGRPPPRVVPLTPMRRTIARRLLESKQTIPHFYLSIEVDAEPLMQARQELNRSLEKQGDKVSLNDLLICACARALRRSPAVNASFQNDSIWYHQVVDVSVAVAVPDGLVTPVVRDADHKGVLEIASEVKELAARARARKLKPEEMSGGTFSVSNLGMYGITEFAAVINPPEGAILAIGAVREEPVVRAGAVVPGRTLKLTLSCDHRVVDGAVGAEWLALLRTLIENPLQLLL